MQNVSSDSEFSYFSRYFFFVGRGRHGGEHLILLSIDNDNDNNNNNINIACLSRPIVKSEKSEPEPTINVKPHKTTNTTRLQTALEWCANECGCGRVECESPSGAEQLLRWRSDGDWRINIKIPTQFIRENVSFAGLRYRFCYFRCTAVKPTHISRLLLLIIII